MPALESVDDLAKLEQITQLAERGCVVGSVIAQRCVGIGIAPVGPRGGNERSAAIRQDDEYEQHAASLDAADHRQRLPLERMARSNDRHIIRMSEWLIRFLEHRISDARVIRLIRKWLKAGVLDDGIVVTSDVGTGQGSVISPLLANIYLHYVFDLWAERWRRREATGDMIVVRYADDVVLGFQHESDARRFLDAMRARFEEFALQLHPDKTRLIEFGRYAAANRERRGFGKPETFNFLGFTFICGRSRRGDFLLKRKSRRDRVRAKLKEIKQELWRQMHWPIPEQGSWLAQVIRGFFN